MSGLTLDAGALIAFERAQRTIVVLLARAHERGDHISEPAGVVAQAWRDGRRQVRLVRLLAAPATDLRRLDPRLRLLVM